MKRKQATKKTGYPRKTVSLARGKTDDETGHRYATLLTSPEFAAYRIERAIQPKNLGDDIDVPGLLATLRGHGTAVNKCDLRSRSFSNHSQSRRGF